MVRRMKFYLAAAAFASLPVTTASAENITFGIIGPHEYELPVNFKDFDAFVQYSSTNFADRKFTSNGGLSRQAGNPATGQIAPVSYQSQTVAYTKVVRFISFDSLPNIGFAPEAIIPVLAQTSASGNGVLDFGVADPIFGGATWIKPNKDSTFGFQTFITAPIGTPNASTNGYTNISTILYDYQFKNWDIDGNTGGVFYSDQRAPGMARVVPGTKFFTNLRIGYKLNQPSFPIEPFFAIDYQLYTGNKDNFNRPIPFTRNTDLALGAGGVITFSDKYNLTVRYSRSVYGLNDYPTNAVYLKLVSILP